LWVGPLGDSPPLTELQLTHSSSPWLLMDPATRQVQQGLSPELQRLLKRRYFLVEKAKGAQLVGLLVGTLGAAGYLQVLQRLQQLVKQVRAWDCRGPGGRGLPCTSPCTQRMHGHRTICSFICVAT
jgi:diphthamide biosynthesis enzyme Dph1/Dph2-like protein